MSGSSDSTDKETPAPPTPGTPPPPTPGAPPTPGTPPPPVQPPPAADPKTDLAALRAEYDKLQSSYTGLQGAQKSTETARKKAQDELEALRTQHADVLGKVTTAEARIAELTQAKTTFDTQLADATAKATAAAAENQKLMLILTKYPNLASVAVGIVALPDAAQMEAQLKQMSEALALSTQAQVQTLVQAQVAGLVPGGSGAGRQDGDPGWEWVRDNLDSQDPDTAKKARAWHDKYIQEGRHPALSS